MISTLYKNIYFNRVINSSKLKQFDRKICFPHPRPFFQHLVEWQSFVGCFECVFVYFRLQFEVVSLSSLTACVTIISHNSNTSYFQGENNK